MDLNKVYENLTFEKIYNKTSGEVEYFTIDTRLIRSNCFYVGIKGDNYDGNNFYLDALKKGAKVAVIENIDITKDDLNYITENNKTIIVVKDTIKFLGDLASYKRTIINIPIIAVTGSAGKTSTKDMIYTVLNEKYDAFKTIGNKNNHLGLPLTLLNLTDEKIAVLEMGMNHLGEISYLSKIARPDVAVITNVGTAHIGNLGSRENILKAKLEILDGLAKEGTLIINNDNDLLHNWLKNYKGDIDIKTYGIHNKSDVMPFDIVEDETESTYTYENILFNVPVAGEHYVYNSLSSIIIGKMFDISLEEIKNGMKKLELTSNRMELTEKDGISYINDAYNANYDAVKYAIKHLGSVEGRKIACLGTMKELGKYSTELHSKLGIEIIDNEIDILITVGEYTDLINKMALENGLLEENSYHFNTNEEAINIINKIKLPDDTILVKASASCNFLEIVDKIVN